MSDEQVSNELKRMVAFIKQEAIEKSREIQIKVEHSTTPQHMLFLRTLMDCRQTKNSL
jgi:V-type H+-transporting ATPase subunit E